MEQLVGELLWWSRRKRIGVIGVRDGLRVERYFVNIVQIELCEPAEPFAGCIVKFQKSLKPIRVEGQFPGADHVEVYRPIKITKADFGLEDGENAATDSGKAGVL